MLYNKITSISRDKKELILLLLDFCAGVFAIHLSLALRFDSVWSSSFIAYIIPLTLFLPFSIIICSRFIRIYRIVLRTTNLQSINLLIFFSILITISFMIIDFLFELNLPRSIPILFFFIFSILIFSYRLILIFLLNKLNTSHTKNNIKRIAIFGAGFSGQQLSRYYFKSKNFKTITFIDDNVNFRNTFIFNIPVFSREKFIKEFNNLNLDEVWIAIPSLNRVNREDIVNFCLKTKLIVRSVADFSQLLQDINLENKLVEVKTNDFLGRKAVDIDTNLYISSYENKNILITGGGGSIGSEVVIQLIKTNPSVIVIIDHSELALYNLERYFNSNRNLKIKCKIIYCLGNICNKNFIKEIISKHQIEVILHCAAYKHVPILEENIIEACRNNIIGTNNLIDSIRNSNVKRFILISTDKAVRPTNVMGATKRLAEQIVKTKSENDKSINYGIVRFGNVLGSSGSVIPLFQKQINDGGPVTITDIKMTRYFMAIDEAAKLVLLAGSFAKESEIFLLDMGKPIKIIELARNMIRLSGLKEKVANSSEGDIEIIEINSRPGEKIHEELLIDENDKKTDHPKVRVVNEKKFSVETITQLIVNITNGVDNNDSKILIKSLIENVENYSLKK